MRDNLPVYVASDKMLQELNDLGYDASIELEDLLDLYDEIDIMDNMVPGIITYDELSFMSKAAAKVVHALTKHG